MKLLFFVFLAIVAAAESLRCEPDSIFKINCNTCRCSKNGEHALCTLKACINLGDSSETYRTRKSRSAEVPEAAESEPICEPGNIFKDYCNTCKCSDDGKDAVCTLMACDENVWNKDGTRKSEIAEGTTDLPIEQSKTTEYDENLQYGIDFPESCTEVKSFKHYCNICYCEAVGATPFCTEMDCFPGMWNRDGISKSDIEYDNTTPHSLEA